MTTEERGSRMRIDRLLVVKGLADSREKARRLVLAGEVLVDDEPVDKPGTLVRERSRLRLRRARKRFVSRGGEKLEGALEGFGLDVRGLRVADIGSSTGGFTDCLLHHGAERVTAVDVGRGQLDWKLYSDPRVEVVEGVNARYLSPDELGEPFDLITIDLAFISLTKVLPALVDLLAPAGQLLALVKPQFELSPEEVGKGGIVRAPERHAKAVEAVAEAARAIGFTIGGLLPSPILGMEGNREFFLLLGRDPTAPAISAEGFADRVREICKPE